MDSSLRRIAIVISGLPKPLASRLLQDVDAETRARIQRSSETLCDVPPAEREAVLQEFRGLMFGPAGAEDNETADRAPDEYPDQFDISSGDGASAGKAELLDSQVASVVSQWELPRSFHSDASYESPFAFLDDVDDEIVVELLSDEHAQTIALVFASITPKQAARILPQLDLDVQGETMRRLGRLDDIPATVAAEVATHLQQRAAQLEHERNNPGHRTLKAIIDAMPVTTDEPEIPTDVPVPITDQSVSEELATELSPGLTNEDVDAQLMQLSAPMLCRALGMVKTREALLALCGLPGDVADAALALLPRPRAREVRRGMANLSSIKLREIDQAKEAVALVSLQFAPSGVDAPLAA